MAAPSKRPTLIKECASLGEFFCAKLTRSLRLAAEGPFELASRLLEPSTLTVSSIRSLGREFFGSLALPFSEGPAKIRPPESWQAIECYVVTHHEVDLILVKINSSAPLKFCSASKSNSSDSCHRESHQFYVYVNL